MTQKKSVADESKLKLLTFFRREHELAKRVVKGVSNLNEINEGLQSLIEAVETKKLENQAVALKNKANIINRRLEHWENLLRALPNSTVHSPWRGRPLLNGEECDLCDIHKDLLIHAIISPPLYMLDDQQDTLQLFLSRDGKAVLNFFFNEEVVNTILVNSIIPKSLEELKTKNKFGLHKTVFGSWQEVYKKTLKILEDLFLSFQDSSKERGES